MALLALAALGWSRSEEWGWRGKNWMEGGQRGGRRIEEGYNNPFTAGLDSN